MRDTEREAVTEEGGKAGFGAAPSSGITQRAIHAIEKSLVATTFLKEEDLPVILKFTLTTYLFLVYPV